MNQNQNNAPSKPVSNYIHKKCLVCNKQFFYSRNEDLDEWTEICWAFRRSFDISENYEPSPFHNTVPFCEKCTREAKKLLTVHKKLKTLQVELERLEASVASALVKSFPSESPEGPNYILKKSLHDKWHPILQNAALLETTNKRPVIQIRSKTISCKNIPKSIPDSKNHGHLTTQESIQPELVFDEALNFTDFLDDDDRPASPLMALSPMQDENDDLAEKHDNIRPTRTSSRKRKSNSNTGFLDLNEEASAAEDDAYAGESDDEFLPEEENEGEDAELESEILKNKKRKTHSSELPGRHPCSSCDKVYRSRKSLSTHYRIHHDPNPAGNEFLCEFPDCGKSFYRRYNLKKHQQIHDPNYYIRLKEDGQKFLCAHCGKSYFYKRGLDHHMEKAHGTGPGGVIREIVKRAIQRKRFPNHPEYPSSGHCDICNKTFHPKYLNSHRRSFHKIGMHSFTCKICGDTMNYKPSLSFHMKQKHPDQSISGNDNDDDAEVLIQNYFTTTRRPRGRPRSGICPGPCHICGKPVTNMSTHVKTHLGLNERPFQCGLCGKFFINATQLRTHTTVHNERRFEETEKQHVCPEPDCGKKFTWYNTYYYHLRKVHGRVPKWSRKRDDGTDPSEPKSFPCPHCPRIVSSKGNLTKHISIMHKRDKGYACTHPGCTRVIFDHGNFSRHLQTHLPESERRIFNCDQCPAVLCRKSDLREHVKRRHNPSKPLPPYVPPALKPFHCPHCPNTGFNSKLTYKNHRNFYCPVTREEGQFSCDLCGNKAFVRKADYHKHLRNVHPEAELPVSNEPLTKLSRSQYRAKPASQRNSVSSRKRGVTTRIVDSSGSSGNEFEGEDLERIDVQAIPRSTRLLRTRTKRKHAQAKASKSATSSTIPAKFASFNFNLSLVLDRRQIDDYNASRFIKSEPLEESESESASESAPVPIIRSYETLAYSNRTLYAPASSSRSTVQPRRTLRKGNNSGDSFDADESETVLGI